MASPLAFGGRNGIGLLSVVLTFLCQHAKR